MTAELTVEFLPMRHPVQRIGEAWRRQFVEAQQSTIERSFDDSYDFCERITNDLRLDIPVNPDLRGHAVEEFANLPFADLQDAFGSMLRADGMPESAIGLHSLNLSRRAQLVRAFDDPDAVLRWAVDKVAAIVEDMPKRASDIECGRNPGDVLDPYLLAATQSLLFEGDFRHAIGATVSHKALMILEGLMGHLHEEVIGQMRGNVKNPEPRAENAEMLDSQSNPFPGADVLQPPLAEGETLRLHQIKSKTGTLNSSGGKRLAEQMRNLRMAYPGAELYSHSLVGNTLKGHRSMGGMLRAEPALIVQVGDASFRTLTGSENGAELLLRLYQSAFDLAAEQTGYSVETMTSVIFDTFKERADDAGEGWLESVLHQSTRGVSDELDSRTYRGRRKLL